MGSAPFNTLCVFHWHEYCEFFLLGHRFTSENQTKSSADLNVNSYSPKPRQYLQLHFSAPGPRLSRHHLSASAAA